MQNEFKIYKICSFIVYGISHRLYFILQFVIDFSRQKNIHPAGKYHRPHYQCSLQLYGK